MNSVSRGLSYVTEKQEAQHLQDIAAIASGMNGQSRASQETATWKHVAPGSGTRREATRPSPRCFPEVGCARGVSCCSRSSCGVLWVCWGLARVCTQVFNEGAAELGGEKR